MTYINELREGDRVGQVFLCKTKVTGTTKGGKSYYSLRLQDRTGQLDGKVWELSNSIEHFDASDFIYVDGEVTSFAGTPQLNIKRIRRASEGEYDTKDYFPVSPYSTEEMYQALLGYLEKIKGPKMHALVKSFFVDDPAFVKQFKEHSAAKTVHHGFIGGLLQHTLRVTEMCYFMCKQYPMMNRDLLLAAAMFHDIGKLEEISDFPGNDYTDNGQLIGHIVIGYSMVKKRMEEMGDFPKKLGSELLHCILAHQGKLEYGSPKVPALLEAVALSHADDADAKIEIMIEELQKDVSGEWLGFQRLMESNIRKSSQE